MSSYNIRVVALFSLVAVLFVGTGFIQSWNVALTIFNMGLISAIMALGVNMQWGYAGLFNVGIMGFVALGGLGTVLVSTPPHRTPSPSTAEANSFTVATGQDRVIDGTPEGKRTTSFVSNETVTTEMPLSQEAEMMECIESSQSQRARQPRRSSRL